HSAGRSETAHRWRVQAEAPPPPGTTSTTSRTRTPRRTSLARSQVIHSGHFMVSSPHSDLAPRRRRSGGSTYRFGPLSAGSLSIDPTLTRLFDCMSLAYSGKIVSPKWKSFKGLRLLWRDKIRLNNAIWRAWFIQYVEKRKNPVCGFVTPLEGSEADSHRKPEAIVLEGSYWKRRIEVVIKEYHKWRIYYKKRFNIFLIKSDILPRKTLRGALAKLEKWTNQMYPQPEATPVEAHMFDLDCLLSDISDTLFTMTQKPCPWASDRHDMYTSNADMIQPGLMPLQPNLDDFMDIPGQATFADCGYFENPAGTEFVPAPSPGLAAPPLLINSQLAQPALPSVGVPRPSSTSQPVQARSDQGCGYPSDLHPMPPPVSVAACFPVPEQMAVAEVSPAPLEVSPAPLEVSPAPLELSLAPLELSPAPLEVSPTPLELSPAPLEVSPAPLEVSPAPLEFSSTPLEVGPAPPEVSLALPLSTHPRPLWLSCFPLAPVKSSERQKSEVITSQLLGKTASHEQCLCADIFGARADAALRPQQHGANWPTAVQAVMPLNSPRAAFVHPSGSDSASSALLAHSGTALLIPKTEKLSPVQLYATDGSSLTVPFLQHPGQTSPPNLSDNVSAPESSHASFSGHAKMETNKPTETRRITHISAEQKRRFNIKLGFDTLHSLVATLSSQPSIKISKATTLQKTAEYISKMQQERAQLHEETQRLREEIQLLNAAINACQLQLPATGVPITRQRFDHMRQKFREYVQAQTLQNWKFWIFSIIIEPLFESYNGMVSTASMEELCRSTLSWLDQHCSLPTLRPMVLRSLRFLSTTTAILTDPSLLPEQATLAVTQSDRSAVL
uniref:MLX interacting protein like n=1 Tax=Tetraodon nigroviridis TaxID=99883 RepID=H3CT04_TETNG